MHALLHDIDELKKDLRDTYDSLWWNRVYSVSGLIVSSVVSIGGVSSMVRYGLQYSNGLQALVGATGIAIHTQNYNKLSKLMDEIAVLDCALNKVLKKIMES